MRPDPAVLGGLLLLVLPVVGTLCVLLTGPVARSIGRRHQEEEQAARAPGIVAGIVLLLEAGLAIALRQAPAVRGGIRVTVGPSAFEIDPYVVGTVTALAVVTLLAVCAAEFSRRDWRPSRANELAAVLFVCAAHVFLALAGSLQMVALAVAVGCLAVSALLLVEAWSRAKSGRAVLVIGAVLLPLIGWLLLLPYRHLSPAADLQEAGTALQAAHLALAHGMLARLWVAGGLLLPIAALLLAALPPTQTQSLPALPALFAISIVGALPALFRITVVAFPRGSPAYCHEWLSPRLAIVAVGLGLLGLSVAQARVSAFLRLGLVALGQTCSLAWLMAAFSKTAASAALLAAVGPAALLGLCFACVPPARRRLPGLWRVAGFLLFVVSWPWAWFGGMAARGIGLYTVAGTALAAMLVLSGIRLSGQAVRMKPDLARPAVIENSLASGRPIFRDDSLVRDVVTVVVLALLGALLAALWIPSAQSLSPPLP
jgi:hypothetical protein